MVLTVLVMYSTVRQISTQIGTNVLRTVTLSSFVVFDSTDYEKCWFSSVWLSAKHQVDGPCFIWHAVVHLSVDTKSVFQLCVVPMGHEKSWNSYFSFYWKALKSCPEIGHWCWSHERVLHNLFIVVLQNQSSVCSVICLNLNTCMLDEM